MFQFAALAFRLEAGMTRLQRAGLSHSEIRGSRVICTSPQLIAAYHVLLRLRGPRHPPCALSYFFSLRASVQILADSHGSCVILKLLLLVLRSCGSPEGLTALVLVVSACQISLCPH